MFTNADITVYQYQPETQKYINIKVEKVFWNNTKQSNILRSGGSNTDTVKILIPASSLHIPIIFTAGKDWVIKGMHEYEIDNSTEKALSESFRYLKDNFRAVTVTSVDERLYGSLGMQHYKLSCK